jgi:hypothetical protein
MNVASVFILRQAEYYKTVNKLFNYKLNILIKKA